MRTQCFKHGHGSFQEEDLQELSRDVAILIDMPAYLFIFEVHPTTAAIPEEIGRASCRERVLFEV